MNREKEIFEELFVRYPALASIREDIKRAYDVMCTCYARAENILGRKRVSFEQLFNIVEQLCGHGTPAARDSCLEAKLVCYYVLDAAMSPAEQDGAFCSADVYTYYMFFH